MNRKELLEKLNQVKTTLATQDIIPVLTHFCFDKDKVTTFNGTQAVIAKFDSGLSCCVPGDLLKLLSSYTTDEVSIQQTEDMTKNPPEQVVAIKVGKSSAVKLKTMDNNNFVFKSEDLIRDSKAVYELTGEFLEGIRQCAISMNPNASQRNQHGITVISTPEKTVLYSSDRARVSSFTLSKSVGATFTILLPMDFCNNVISLSKDFKGGKLYVGSEYLILEATVEGIPTGLQIYSRFDNNVIFITFENILSKVSINPDKYQAVPESLLSCVDRNLILVSSDKNPEIDIKVEGQVMTITSSNDFGNISDEIEMEKPVESVDCKMKPLFVRQFALASDKMAFSSFGGNSVLVGTRGNFLHMVSASASGN